MSAVPASASAAVTAAPCSRRFPPSPGPRLFSQTPHPSTKDMALRSQARPAAAGRATSNVVVYAFSCWSAWLQDCSQRWHASAQTRQCSCMSAWSEHSLAHDAQAARHASMRARTVAVSGST